MCDFEKPEWQCGMCSNEYEGYNCTDCGIGLCGECFSEYEENICENCMEHKIEQEQK